jgi:hypothetical protein
MTDQKPATTNGADLEAADALADLYDVFSEADYLTPAEALELERENARSSC